MPGWNGSGPAGQAPAGVTNDNGEHRLLSAIPLASLAILLAPREGGNSATIFLVQLLLFFAIFYFILIRPQRREQQRHKEMLKAIGKGDRVMTNGGIIGQVVRAGEQELTIKTAENTRLVVDRGHIARKLTDAEE